MTQNERDESTVQQYLPYVRREPFRAPAEFVGPFVTEPGQSDEDRILLDSTDLNVDIVSMRDNGGKRTRALEAKTSTLCIGYYYRCLD